MIIVFDGELSERSLLVIVNRKLARLDTGDCWNSNMIFFSGSALFVVFALWLSVSNVGCNWRFGNERNCGQVEGYIIL
jgi:hypothetical protein